MAQYDNEFMFEMLGQPVDIGVYQQDQYGDVGDQLASYGGVLESYLENYSSGVITWALRSLNPNTQPLVGSIVMADQKIIIAWRGTSRG